jgi:hypothetical protein
MTVHFGGCYFRRHNVPVPIVENIIVNKAAESQEHWESVTRHIMADPFGQETYAKFLKTTYD